MMGPRPGLVGVVSLLASACVDPSRVASQTAALGELQNGFPNAWERAVFMAANRARSDPQQVKGPQSAMYTPKAPLVIDYNLERSSRFHATMLAKGHAPLMHPSPCQLRTDVATSGCDGDPACGCQTGMTCNTCDTASCTAGTDPWTRIGLFGGGGSGEVAAAGYSDPFAVVDGWVDEPAGADGHRMIVDGDSGSVGFGHADGVSNSCWNGFDVGDFGFGGSAPAKLAGAATNPHAGSAGTYRVYASWNDPGAGSPRDLYAVVDGACTPMTREMGDDHLNGTWYADVALGSGCHAVYALAHDAGGARLTYPTTTAFVVSVDGNCAPEQAQPQASCDGTAPPDLARPGSGDGGSPSTRDGGSRRDGAHGDGGDNTVMAGGCSVAPGRASPSTLLLFLVPLMLPLASAWLRRGKKASDARAERRRCRAPVTPAVVAPAGSRSRERSCAATCKPSSSTG